MGANCFSQLDYSDSDFDYPEQPKPLKTDNSELLREIKEEAKVDMRKIKPQQKLHHPANKNACDLITSSYRHNRIYTEDLKIKTLKLCSEALNAWKNKDNSTNKDKDATYETKVQNKKKQPSEKNEFMTQLNSEIANILKGSEEYIAKIKPICYQIRDSIQNLARNIFSSIHFIYI